MPPTATNIELAFSYYPPKKNKIGQTALILMNYNPILEINQQKNQKNKNGHK